MVDSEGKGPPLGTVHGSGNRRRRNGTFVWRSRWIRLLVIGIVVFMFITLMFYVTLGDRYTVEVRRVASTEDGRHAIQVVESLEVGQLLNTSRYSLWSDEHVDDPPDDLDRYVYPRVIDSISIEYFTWRVDAQRKLYSNDRATFEYAAEGASIQGLLFRTEVMDEFTFLSSDDPGIEHRYTSAWVSPSLEPVNASSSTINTYQVETGYLVVQELNYKEYYAPLAAYFGSVDQVAVLAEDYSILMIAAKWSMAIA